MLETKVEKLRRELRGVISQTRSAGFLASAEAMELVLLEMQHVPTRHDAAREPLVS